MRNPIIYPQPHDGTDLLWTLLSVFTLTIEDQITFIGGLTNDELEVRDKMFISNSLLLKHALICREKSWVDEFSFLYDDKNEDFDVQYNDAFQLYLKDIGQYPLLSRNEEKRIFKLLSDLKEKFSIFSFNENNNLDFVDAPTMIASIKNINDN